MLGVMVFSTANSGGMRLMLLSLVLVAVVLLLTGGTIALLTLFHQRRSNLVRIASNQLESEKLYHVPSVGDATTHRYPGFTHKFGPGHSCAGIVPGTTSHSCRPGYYKRAGWPLADGLFYLGTCAGSLDGGPW